MEDDPYSRPPRQEPKFFENPTMWLVIAIVGLAVAVGAYIATRDVPDQPAPTTTGQPRR